MEQKRFGVKISLLNELRTFQSMLKKRKILYMVDLTSSTGTHPDIEIQTAGNHVCIPLPGFAIFPVTRANYVNIDSQTVSLAVNTVVEITIKFQCEQEKEAFKRDMLVKAINRSANWTPSLAREG